MSKDAEYAAVVNIRVTEELSKRLDALVAKYPMLNRHALARAALGFGLDTMERDAKWFEKAPKAK